MQQYRSDIVEQLPEDLTRLLGRLSEGLKGLYGDRYRGLVLYGSYARGEADEGSDVDLLLLLDGDVNTTEEIVNTEPVEWPLSLEAGYAVALIPVQKEKYELSEQPFLRNARDEGIRLG